MGKEFQVNSPEDEHQQLLRAANFLDKRMREIRESGKVLGLERIAIMAALNISYELQAQPKGESEQDTLALNRKMQTISDSIDAALASGQQIELN